jgi:ribokinase
MKRIAVIGSINMDMVVHTPRIPALGETILGSGFQTVPGGKGANQAVAAARLGGNVAMLGCVGDDFFGSALTGNLQMNGVDIRRIAVIENCASGVAVITVMGGDNCIIVDPGANSRVSTEMMDAAEDWIAQSAMVVLQLEIPLPAVERAMRIAKKHGVKILLNPAPAVKLSGEILQMADFLTPNETECGILAGMEVHTPGDAVAAAARLRDMGANTVVVTLGENGVVALGEGSAIRMGARKVKAVDTTAAGDTFTAALALGLVRGKALEEAIGYANAAASITVTRHGAQLSLPTEEEVLKIMN